MPVPVDIAISGGDIARLAPPDISILSSAGVERLSLNPSVENRIETANRVGAVFADGGLSVSAREIAAAILEVLSQDVALGVRQATCEQVLHCPFLPPNIARRLAQDVDSVAVPIIRCSTALSDADLIALIGDRDTLAQVSVAGRDTVSPAVAHELVHTGKKTIVKTVLANDGAEISEASLFDIVDAFGDVPSVQSLMVDRPALPPTVTLCLTSLVSDPLAERLVARHYLPPRFIGQLVAHGQESVLGGLIGASSSARQVEFVARSMGRAGTLTPTFVLRMLCVGNFDFFVALMASLAGITAANARTLMNDAGRDGFRALFQQSGLPDEIYAGFRVALEVALDFRPTGQHEWNAAATQTIVRDLAKAYDDVSPDGLESVLQQLALQLPEDRRTIVRVNWIH